MVSTVALYVFLVLLTRFSVALSADRVPKQVSPDFKPISYLEASGTSENANQPLSKTGLAKRYAQPGGPKRPREGLNADSEKEAYRTHQQQDIGDWQATQPQRVEDITALLRQDDEPALWYNRPLGTTKVSPDIPPNDDGATVQALYSKLILALGGGTLATIHQYRTEQLDAIEENGYALAYQWVNQHRIPWPRHDEQGLYWRVQPTMGNMPLPLDTGVMLETPGDLGYAPPIFSAEQGLPQGLKRRYSLATWLRRLLDLERVPLQGRRHDPQWGGMFVFARGNFALSYQVVRLEDPALKRLLERRPVWRMVFPSFRAEKQGGERFVPNFPVEVQAHGYANGDGNGNGHSNRNGFRPTGAYSRARLRAGGRSNGGDGGGSAGTRKSGHANQQRPSKRRSKRSASALNTMPSKYESAEPRPSRPPLQPPPPPPPPPPPSPVNDTDSDMYEVDDAAFLVLDKPDEEVGERMLEATLKVVGADWGGGLDADGVGGGVDGGGLDGDRMGDTDSGEEESITARRERNELLPEGVRVEELMSLVFIAGIAFSGL
ncbi:MAG: hypothetical protein M1831_002937 [Alyxoria varia]|nr:MAG: hypothetical protein M1831_002937 [Alyxoria varia]